MRTRHVLTLMRLAVLALVPVLAPVQLAAAETESADAAAFNPDKFDGDADAIEAGRQLYGNTCLFCHGPKGVGARAPNLIEGMFKPGRESEIPFAYDVIMKGRPGTIMGGFSEMLSEDEVWNVIAYLRDEGRKKMAK
jgi:mono/diheme cytochrome c family protein